MFLSKITLKIVKFYKALKPIYQVLFWALIVSPIVLGIIFLGLYLGKVGPFRRTFNSNKPGPSPSPSPSPGPSPGPSPSQCPQSASITGNVVGSWVNVAGGTGILSDVTDGQDLLMLASFSPSPWSILYHCDSVFSMFPADFSDLKQWVSLGHQKSKLVLMSIGGSSFGLPEWQDLLYKYTKQGPLMNNCCPSGASWYSCDQPESGCCPDADKQAGRCAGLMKQNCCSDTNNPHKCCCGYGKVIKVINGQEVCVAKNPTNCPIYGVVNQSAIDQCMNDPNKTDGEKHLCILENTDPVLAYAKMLNETCADGIDFDFESPDPAGKLATALVQFAGELKAYMLKTYNKKTYYSITILSGNSYGAQYGGIYNSIKSSSSPFDFAIPMLYNGGQYPYDTNVNSVSQNHWNGLLNYWRQNFLTPQSNTKLVAAFIEYSAPKINFTCQDLQHFINDYINSNNIPGVKVQGAVYFYYTGDSGYDVMLMHEMVSKTRDCFHNNQCNISCNSSMYSPITLV